MMTQPAEANVFSARDQTVVRWDTSKDFVPLDVQ